MASIIFFTLFTLTLTSTIHAREAQLFNKFSNNIPQESKPLNTNQQQPEFIPQTQDSAAYGLYGHGSGQLPPSDTATLPENLPENYNPVAYTTPIHSSTQDVPEEFKDPQAYTYHGQSRMYNSQMQEGGRYYGRGSGYNSQKRGFDDARFVEREDGGNMYNSEMQEENGRYNSEMQEENGRYNSEKQEMSNTRYGTSNNANMYSSEKQGMSDTRFLENGKYYYDVNMENINSNANANMNTRRYNNWRNEYKTQGYYGNNENSYDRYNTNTNSNYNYNYNGGGYEGQEDQFNP